MNDQKMTEHHWNDADGNPAGGQTSSIGMCLAWQDGPLGRGEDRKEPNGTFVETVIRAAIGRLNYYQKSRFECETNAQAICRLEEALLHLAARTADREDRDVEGTHVE